MIPSDFNQFLVNSLAFAAYCSIAGMVSSTFQDLGLGTVTFFCFFFSDNPQPRIFSQIKTSRSWNGYFFCFRIIPKVSIFRHLQDTKRNVTVRPLWKRSKSLILIVPFRYNKYAPRQRFQSHGTKCASHDF